MFVLLLVLWLLLLLLFNDVVPAVAATTTTTTYITVENVSEHRQYFISFLSVHEGHCLLLHIISDMSMN